MQECSILHVECEDEATELSILPNATLCDISGFFERCFDIPSHLQVVRRKDTRQIVTSDTPIRVQVPPGCGGVVLCHAKDDNNNNNNDDADDNEEEDDAHTTRDVGVSPISFPPTRVAVVEVIPDEHANSATAAATSTKIAAKKVGQVMMCASSSTSSSGDDDDDDNQLLMMTHVAGSPKLNPVNGKKEKKSKKHKTDDDAGKKDKREKKKEKKKFEVGEQDVGPEGGKRSRREGDDAAGPSSKKRTKTPKQCAPATTSSNVCASCEYGTCVPYCPGTGVAHPNYDEGAAMLMTASAARDSASRSRAGQPLPPSSPAKKIPVPRSSGIFQLTRPLATATVASFTASQQRPADALDIRQDGAGQPIEGILVGIRTNPDCHHMKRKTYYGTWGHSDVDGGHGTPQDTPTGTQLSLDDHVEVVGSDEDDDDEDEEGASPSRPDGYDVREFTDLLDVRDVLSEHGSVRPAYNGRIIHNPRIDTRKGGRTLIMTI
eukprot:PhM_4_TR16428/c0_g1_i1/m.36521